MGSRTFRMLVVGFIGWVKYKKGRIVLGACMSLVLMLFLLQWSFAAQSKVTLWNVSYDDKTGLVKVTVNCNSSMSNPSLVIEDINGNQLYTGDATTALSKQGLRGYNYGGTFSAYSGNYTSLWLPTGTFKCYLKYDNKKSSDYKTFTVNYNYFTYGSLKVIRTRCSNVKPVQCRSNVPDSGYYGVNGGLFSPRSDGTLSKQPQLVSIAINNGRPLYPDNTDPNNKNLNFSGWYNLENLPNSTKIGQIDRGTLVYTRGICSVFKAGSGVSIPGSWAIGGISMGLMNEKGWYANAKNAERMPEIDNSSYWTGAVFDSTSTYIYLITSSWPMKASAFRSEIVSMNKDYKNLRLYDGIFLDGGGSSQMACGPYKSYGSDKYNPAKKFKARNVPDMLALINK